MELYLPSSTIPAFRGFGKWAKFRRLGAGKGLSAFEGKAKISRLSALICKVVRVRCEKGKPDFFGFDNVNNFSGR